MSPRAEVADVAIVGVGAMGAVSAWRLAGRGASVIGFERFQPGHDRGSSHGDTRIFRTAYFESPDYVPLLRRAHVLWRQLEGETRVQLLTETGGLMIGMPDSELVTGVLRSAAENHLPHRVLTRDEMARTYPQHRLERGEVAVFEEWAGHLRPERAVEAAASRAAALGARIMADTVVTSIEPGGPGVLVETNRGGFAARRALVTAGAWTLKLLPRLRLPLEVERQVVAWFAVDDATDFSPERFPIFIHELSGERYRYGFPTTDERSIKLGVHHEGATADPENLDRDVREEDLAPVRAFAAHSLRGVGRVERTSVCMYTNAPGERFIVVSPAEMPGVTVLNACSGHGFKFAPVLGDLIADLLLEGRPLPPIIRTDLSAPG